MGCAQHPQTRGSNGFRSKPFINHPLTTRCGFGQCWSPACCRKGRLEDAALLGTTEGLCNPQYEEYKLSLQDRKMVGTSLKSPLPRSTAVLRAGVRWFSYYLFNSMPTKLNRWGKHGQSLIKSLFQKTRHLFLITLKLPPHCKSNSHTDSS